MPNKNYVKGRNKEYRLKRKFEKEGFIVLRTAGSHGFADLILISEEEKKIVFVQVKPKGYSDNRIKKLNDKYSWIKKKFSCDFEVL